LEDGGWWEVGRDEKGCGEMKEEGGEREEGGEGWKAEDNKLISINAELSYRGMNRNLEGKSKLRNRSRG